MHQMEECHTPVQVRRQCNFHQATFESCEVDVGGQQSEGIQPPAQVLPCIIGPLGLLFLPYSHHIDMSQHVNCVFVVHAHYNVVHDSPLRAKRSRPLHQKHTSGRPAPHISNIRRSSPIKILRVRPRTLSALDRWHCWERRSPLTIFRLPAQSRRKAPQARICLSIRCDRMISIPMVHVVAITK